MLSKLRDIDFSSLATKTLDLLGLEEGWWERVVGLLTYNPSAPMTLDSGFFLFAFLIFGIGYMAVKPLARLRTLYVVLFSLYFYYKLSGIHRCQRYIESEYLSIEHQLQTGIYIVGEAY